MSRRQCKICDAKINNNNGKSHCATCEHVLRNLKLVHSSHDGYPQDMDRTEIENRIAAHQRRVQSELKRLGKS